MPIYEYRCKNCAKEFEQIQKISDPPAKKCPACNSKKVERLISNTSFQLKGTGWYVTDYARKGKKEGSESAAPKKVTPAEKKSSN